MPKYPVRQVDVMALAEAMISGYQQHPDMFVNADPVLLRSIFDAYNQAAEDQLTAVAKAQIATQAKQTAFERLQKTIKSQLKQSQVDTAGNPENLNYIGWGPRAVAHPVESPGQPMMLESVDEGAGTLTIRWKRPVQGSGGPVRTYIIERRQLASGQSQVDDNSRSEVWKQAGISLETTVSLKDQPRGVQLEYRTMAINKSGQSEPSNTIAVVL